MEVKSIARITAATVMAFVLISGCATNQAPGNSMPASPPESRGIAVPEGGYTWQQLANMAVAARADYAAVLAEAQAAYYRYKARTDLKDLKGSMEYSFISNDVKDNKYGFGLSASIPDPFVNWQYTRAGEAARRETETSAEDLKNKITASVYVLVQQILLGEKELAVLYSREQVLSDWEAYIKQRNNARVVTQTDMRTFDLRHLKLKADIQQAQRAQNAAKRSLQVLVQIPPEQLVLKPDQSDWAAIQALLKDDQAFIDNALSRSAGMAGANAAYEKACAMLSAARAKQIPWFDTVQLSYVPIFTSSVNSTYTGGLFSSQPESNKWKLGVTVDLPVFAWFSFEKKAAAADVEVASLRLAGIRQQISGDLTGTIADLRDTLTLLNDYRSAYDSISKPSRETVLDAETYYKLLDDWLSSSEYTLETELRCARIYSQLLKITGVWE